MKEPKITDIRDAITLYFYNKGQRLTNIKKAPMNKLTEIISKYNLCIENLLDDLKGSRERNKIIEEERKAEQDRIDAEYKKLKEEESQKKLMMWTTLSEDDKYKVKEAHYNRYVKETTENIIQSKLSTDKMEEAFKKDGIFVVRESDNVLIVKGVRVINGYDTTIISREEYEKNDDYDDWVASYKFNEKLILNLYEAEMIKQGFLLRDGKFYKTIKVKK